MVFQHRFRSFKCFSVLLGSFTVFFIYQALIEPKLRHATYAISLRRLEILLNNFSGPPICTNVEALPVSYQNVLCRDWSYGKLPRKVTRVISAENSNYQFENELEMEFGKRIHFFLFSIQKPELDFRNDTYFRIISKPWLTYALWVPYFGRHALLSSFRQFLLESAMPQAAHTIFKFGNLHNKLNPWLLGEIIDEETFQACHQLHIRIQIEGENPIIVQQWMDAVNKLQKHGYRLFNTKLINRDNINAKNGELEPYFLTSWIRMQEQQHAVKAVINPLDPNINLEEQLLNLLAKPTINCSRRITVSVPIEENNSDSSSTIAKEWPVCMEEVHKPCIVYSAKFGGPETFETAMANLGCSVFLFDPTLSVTDENRGPGKRIRALRFMMGTVNAKVVSGIDTNESESFLTYVKANEIAEKLNHRNEKIDVLRMDLHGGEWDVLQNLASSQLIENYQQIVVTMHVWHGEEVFSLIDRFMRLQKLLNAGFEVFYSRTIESSFPQGDQRDQSCCFVVGWLKVR